TLTSIASCLTQQLVIAPPPSPPPILSAIQEISEKDVNNDNQQIPLCRSNRAISLKSKLQHSPPTLQDFVCDNQEKPLLDPNMLSSDYSLVQSLRTYSNDLISDIELLINDKIRSVQESYRQQIAELQEQNQLKDLRIG
ncbi:unnamed protein product, partial [Adineta steineri]